jgi:hypothetical protein
MLSVRSVQLNSLMDTQHENLMGETLDQLLHDADRAQGGASFARQMGDSKNAKALEQKAISLYEAALARDPQMTDPAWGEDGNRDVAWLRWAGLAQIADHGKEKK